MENGNYVVFVISIKLSLLNSSLEATHNLSKHKQSFEVMKIDTLFVMKQRSSDLERKLKQNYKSDSVDLNLGRRIDAYKRMRRMFGPLGALGTKLSNAFNEESLQLQHLYYDVENGFEANYHYNSYFIFKCLREVQ